MEKITITNLNIDTSHDNKGSTITYTEKETGKFVRLFLPEKEVVNLDTKVRINIR